MEVYRFLATRHTLNSIDWENYENDPIYQLVFPQPGMTTTTRCFRRTWRRARPPNARRWSRPTCIAPILTIGGGFPVGALAGRAAMELFDRAAVQRLNRLGDLARSRIAEVIRLAGVPACVTGAGSMFRIHMKAERPQDYRSVYPSEAQARSLKLLLDHLAGNGVLMIETGSAALSTPMTEHEIDLLSAAMLSGLRRIKSELSTRQSGATQ